MNKKAAALAEYELLMDKKAQLWAVLNEARELRNKADARCKAILGEMELIKPALGEAWENYRNA